MKNFKELTRQNTGSHFLDSGGKNGRHWQQGDAPTELISKIDAKVSDDSMYGCMINTGEYLDNVLDLDHDLNKEFLEFSKKKENENEAWFELVEAFAELKEFKSYSRDNTCNSETDLSQGFVFELFSTNHGISDYYYSDEIIVCVQTHNGADIRGGYSMPLFAKPANECIAESGFFDMMVGWNILEGIDSEDNKLSHDECQRLDETYQVGYSGNPSYQLNEDIKTILEINKKENEVRVELESGEKVWLYPNVRIDF